ncbi:hypothetical protein [Pectobacterium versatile]|uniref:hypothetical protein n=1 Tax=Pectobacterium versatile TaxID=2488639 RepID=UPI00382B892E
MNKKEIQDAQEMREWKRKFNPDQLPKEMPPILRSDKVVVGGDKRKVTPSFSW